MIWLDYLTLLLIVTLGVICYKLNKKAIRDEYIPSNDRVLDFHYVPKGHKKPPRWKFWRKS